MSNFPENPACVLEHGLSGFHQYIFDGGARLCYASASLCEMTGYTEEEFLSGDGDFYAFSTQKGDDAVMNDIAPSKINLDKSKFLLTLGYLF